MIIRKRKTLVASVHVDLGEAEVDLRYDFNARAALLDVLTPADFARFEAASKDEKDAAKFPVSALIKFVWAGTQHEEDAPTLKEVGSWIHEDKLAVILAAAMGAMEAHGFTAKSEDDQGGGESENPTGHPESGVSNSAASGQSEDTTAG